MNLENEQRKTNSTELNMVNKIITVYRSEVETTTRLEPRFYYKSNLLKNSFAKFGYEEINNFATLKSGSTPEHSENRKGDKDYYFIKSADVKRHNLNFSTISFIASKVHKSRLNFKIIPMDILLSSVGRLGFACIIPPTLKESSTSQNVIRIRFKEKNLTKFNPYFLVAFLNSQFGQIQIEALSTLSGQRYLNMKSFGGYKIPKIDDKIIEEISLKVKNAENNEIEALSLLKQARKIFYQKLGIDFSKIKKENFYSVNASSFLEADLWTPKYSYPLYINTLKVIQEQWKTVLLDEIATVKKGDEVGSENYNSYLEKEEDDIPFIRTSDLVNYEADQFPDFYVSEKIYNEKNQDIKTNDVLFIKDGNNRMRSAMITKNDKIIISSHIVKLRLKIEAKKYNFTPEYLFLVLSLKEIGFYSSIRRTVIASTLPCLREDKLKEIEIPILDKDSIDEITKLVKKAFELKGEKKKLIEEVQKEIDSYFQV